MKAVFVTKRLAFGRGITKWRDVEQLQELGITHVINLRRHIHDKKVRQFKCSGFPLRMISSPVLAGFTKSSEVLQASNEGGECKGVRYVPCGNLPERIVNVFFPPCVRKV